MGSYTPEHLAHVDPEVWPALVTLPEPGPLIDWRARRAERRFSAACSAAGLQLDDATPDLVVVHDELFVRLAESGWLGLAEGYLAGEWTAPNLTEVLTKLLETGYQPQGKTISPTRAASKGDGRELPADLVQLFSEDGVSAFGALFASGIPTTERQSRRSFVPGAGRGSEPAAHFVDVTGVSAPIDVERADFLPGQQRAVQQLLDSAQVLEGADVLEYPSSGGALALAASARGATVDVLTADPEHQVALEEYVTLGGAADYVHPYTLAAPFPSRDDWRGRYDCILSMEKLEHMGSQGRVSYFKALDRMLTVGGFIGMQTVVATERFGTVSKQALAILRSYIWPALRYSELEDIHKIVDKETGLRIVAERTFGQHYQESLAIQRLIFEGNHREAAATGYDAVFRRLWIFHFALLEALFKLGCLEAVQLTLTSRNRAGRR